MFWQIIFYLTALQAFHVFCDVSSTSSNCGNAYSQLENLCYDYTGLAAEYFSLEDTQQRDGSFAAREASIYVAYNACCKITQTVSYHRMGVEMETEKDAGSGASAIPSNVPSTDSNPTSTSPTSPTSSPTNPASSPEPSTNPTPATTPPPKSDSDSSGTS